MSATAISASEPRRGRVHSLALVATAVALAAVVSLGSPSVAVASASSPVAAGSPAPGGLTPHAAPLEKAALPVAADAAAKMSVGAVPAWVREPAYDSAPSAAEKIQGHATEYLLLDYQARGFDAPEYFNHVVARVLTTDGVDEFGEITVNFDPSYQSLVWHRLQIIRDGVAINQLDPTKIRLLQRETDMESKMFDGSVSAIAVLEDLRPGDIVEYAFTTIGENPIFGGKLSLTYYPEMGRPLRQFAVRVVDAKERTLATRCIAAKVAPLLPNSPRPRPAKLVVADTDQGREYTWSGNDIEPLETEDGCPGWFDPWPRIELSQYPDWASVVRWALELYEQPAALPAELEARVAAWEKQFPKTDQRAEAAVRFVQDEIRYLGIEAGENSHRPHPPAEVYARRFGDCKDKTTLAVALLHRLGVKAWPALIASAGGPEIPAELPSPYVFDHVIVAYELGGALRFVDVTQQRQGGRLIDSEVPAYDWTLLVRAGEKALTAIPRKKYETPVRLVKERFVFSAKSDDARLEVETTFLGPEADSQRETLARTTRQRLAMTYLNFYARELPGVELAAEPTWTDDRAANRIVVRETYIVHEPWTLDEAGKSKRIEMNAREIGELVEKPRTLRRRTPLALGWPIHLKQTIEVVLPGGWSVEAEHFEKESEHVAFKARSSAKGDTLVLEYTYRTKTDVVAPGAMRAHLKVLGEIADHLSYPVDVEAEELPKAKVRSR